MFTADPVRRLTVVGLADPAATEQADPSGAVKAAVKMEDGPAKAEAAQAHADISTAMDITLTPGEYSPPVYCTVCNPLLIDQPWHDPFGDCQRDVLSKGDTDCSVHVPFSLQFSCARRLVKWQATRRSCGFIAGF